MSVKGKLAVYTKHWLTGRTVIAPDGESSLRGWMCMVQDGRGQSGNSSQLPYVKEVEFILHPSFENPRRVRTKAPFRIQEEGWGQFDLRILVHFFHCSEVFEIDHWLAFPDGGKDYQVYPFKIPNPTPGFLTLYNKSTTAVSRKTIPARATKARKGLPRDSNHTSQRRSPYDSDSGSSDIGSDSDGGSDGGAGRDMRNGRMIRQERSAKEPARASTSIKHGPMTGTGGEREQRRRGGNSRTTPGSEHLSSPASPGDHYQKTAHTARPGAQNRRPRDESQAARRLTAQSITPQRARAPADIGSSPNRPDRIVAGAKRRLPVEPARTPSSSPPSGGSRTSVKRTTTGDSGVRPIKRSLAGAIADVRVPKKRPARAMDDDMEATGVKAGGIGDVPVPKKRAIKMLSDEDRSPRAAAVLPQQSPRKPLAAASSREAFIRERERQRQAPLHPAGTGSSGIRPAKQGSSGIVARQQRPPPNGSTATVVKGRVAEPINEPASDGRRQVNRRESVGAMAAARQKQPMPPPAVPAGGARRTSRSRERVSPLFDQSKAALINSVPRMKRTGTNGAVEKAMQSTQSVQPVQPTQPVQPPSTTDKMLRIMRKTQSMDDISTVRFLHLLYTLRVEQDPAREHAITTEVLGAVDADKFSYNLSVLQPKAIDRLWAFVKKIPSS